MKLENASQKSKHLLIIEHTNNSSVKLKEMNSCFLNK